MANFLLNICQLDENSEYLDTWIPDNREMTPFLRLRNILGARGSVVVKALCYKPEGRWFDTR
jgi:hypothetical protein